MFKRDIAGIPYGLNTRFNRIRPLQLLTALFYLRPFLGSYLLHHCSRAPSSGVPVKYAV